MKQITEQAIHAFIEGRAFSKGNTEVIVERTQPFAKVTLLLHSNAIARWSESKGYEINFCGWTSRLTIERLNGLTLLLDHCNLFHKVKGILCADGDPIQDKEWYQLSSFLGKQL